MTRGLLRYGAGVGLAALVCGVVLPAHGEHDGWSLFPPLCAIAVAVLTGRLVLGLVSALIGSALIVLPAGATFPGAGVQALHTAAVDFVWTPLSESFQLYILAFTVSLIGMVRVVAVAGGTRGIAERLAAGAHGRITARLFTWLLGLAIFFDDYSNTLVVGTTMRPVFDRFGVSREKLAYLVDATAAPVAGVALVSTWIGYEVGLFQDAMTQVGAGISGYELFFRALPSRFYCFLALICVGASTLLRRDLGPMLGAERRAAAGAGPEGGDGTKPSSPDAGAQLLEPPGVVADWRVAAAPVAVVIGGVLAGMQWSVWDQEAVTAVRAARGFFSQVYWTTAFSHANSARVMFLAALAGSVVAGALAVLRRGVDGRRRVTPWHALRAWAGGATGFAQPLVILVLAWAIKEACLAVGTGDYLVAALGDRLPPPLLPVLVFLLAAAIAFAIGTSWTTMAILLPTTIPLAHGLGGLPITVLVAAAVLDGAIFGDHCSPISDTTILSSIAAGCDHLAHVKTQLPYATLTMAVAALFGYLGTAVAYPAWVGLVLGAAVLAALLWLLGDDPDRQAHPPPAVS